MKYLTLALLLFAISGCGYDHYKCIECGAGYSIAYPRLTHISGEPWDCQSCKSVGTVWEDN